MIHRLTSKNLQIKWATRRETHKTSWWRESAESTDRAKEFRSLSTGDCSIDHFSSKSPPDSQTQRPYSLSRKINSREISESKMFNSWATSLSKDSRTSSTGTAPLSLRTWLTWWLVTLWRIRLSSKGLSSGKTSWRNYKKSSISYRWSTKCSEPSSSRWSSRERAISTLCSSKSASNPKSSRRC